MKLLQVEAVFC